ncbi:MAG TPA: transposase, partial [Opitutales bacterium]|nr:transposase [Opitutales bacterium]
RQLWDEAHPGQLTGDQIRERDELFRQQIDHWLDQGIGSCLLSNPNTSAITSKAIHFFDGTRYRLEAYVVMPNHVHLMLRPNSGHRLPKILHSLKSFTSNEINKLVKRKGSLWQDESYDRIVRSPEEMSHFREYIRKNPQAAKIQIPPNALYLR